MVSHGAALPVTVAPALQVMFVRDFIPVSLFQPRMAGSKFSRLNEN
jgi:hypothetical protein